MTSITRRGLLAGVACAGVAALLRDAAAQGSPRPRRLVVMFTPNGTVRDAWSPRGGESDFVLGDILAPLERHRARLVVLDGIVHRTAADGPGDGHQKGIGQMLTGVALLSGGFSAGMASPAGYAGGASVDQVVASAIDDGRRFRSLEFGVQCGAADNWSRMCFRAPGAPLPPMEDPLAAYARLFAGGDGDAARARLTRRRSALDHALGDLATLRASLPATERARVDAYADAVREAERSLPVGAFDGARCGVAELPARASDDPARLPELGAAQTRLLVASLACGLTRVASLQWTRAASPATFPWLGVYERHHDLSHLPPDDVDARAKLVGVGRWYSERFADLLDGLAAAGDGETSLLDDTLVVWCNELATGYDHGSVGVPWVLAAGRNIPLRTGRALRYDGASHNDLLATICRAMGLDATTTFGDPRYATGALSGLLR